MSRIAKRRSILTRLARGESGYGTLTAVLILLILGALVLTPLLVYMNIGLEAGETHERRTDELYATDAGVNYALWQIRTGNVPTKDNPTLEFDFPEPINDKDVHVELSLVELPGEEDKPAYRIVSVATTDLPAPDDTSTTVESYVTLDYSTASLLQGAITSVGDADVRNDVVGDVICGGNLYVRASITGDVLCRGNVWIEPSDPELGTSPGWIYGNVRCGGTVSLPERVTGQIEEGIPDLEIPEVDFYPTADIFRELYRSQVNVAEPYPFYIIDVVSTPEIPVLYRDIDQGLRVLSSADGAEATLTGTVYVAGENSLLTIGGQQKNFTLDLAGNTIYCEGDIDIFDKCTIKGSGCIIAEGDVFFGPNMYTDPGQSGTDFVFIMSIYGFTKLQPSGDFSGTVAGYLDVLGQPGGTLNWWEVNPGDLNIPLYNTAEISTYNIYNYVAD